MIKRDSYISKIMPFVDTDAIKLFTGIRRCGKSVMLELVKQKLVERGVHPSRIISFNFEDIRNSSLLDAESLHNEILSFAQKTDGKIYVFLDEIQEVANWQKCINSLRVTANCDLYITGSNAKLLSGELSTYLAGRYVQFNVFPFSFSEYLDLYRSTFPDSDHRDAFRKYLSTGGMPYISNLGFNDAPIRQYLSDVFDSVQFKDISLRHNIRDAELLQRIIHYAIANVGSTFSATSIAKFLKNERRKVSTETVLNYLKYCCDAFLLHRIKRHDIAGKTVLSTQEKYYITDHGMREAVCGPDRTDIGATLENIVCLELLRRDYSVSVGKLGNREIDFIAEKPGIRIYVQVAYLLATPETVEREFGVFSSVQDNHPKYVLSLDEIDFSRNGIRHLNIRDFLLSSTWSELP